MVASAMVRWKKAYNDDAVRLVVGRPRRIPRRKREEMASILAQELFGSRKVVDARRHAARYGAFHVVLRLLKETPAWSEMRGMAAKSDIIAAMALRGVVSMVLDIMDRTVLLPSDTEEERAMGGLIALTVHAWQRQTAIGRDDVLRAVEELEAIDARGEARGALRDLMGDALREGMEELRSYLSMLSMMEQLLPPGEDEISVEEVFVAYLRDVDRMAQLLQMSSQLQRIIDLMGQLDVEFGAKREKAQSFSTQEAYALGRSKDVQHVLPVELLKLKVPILQTLFFSQMLEGELLTYELKGLNWSAAPERRRKGPVVALIDASGSMVGEPELLAKSLILMLARRMAREKREIKVILFAANDWKFELNLSDKKKMAQNLLDIVCRQFEGGTDFNSALRVGLETVREKEWRGADILFFTDGMSQVSDQDLVGEWLSFKKRTQSRIYTLIVGSDQAGGLEKVSDHTWVLSAGTWDVEGSPSNIIKLIADG
ncbi:VWA domain-containing protein [Methanomassiliicoccus luminyensis]|uniref:VWA domain-containing protein n=1 Tax=Methanomassiliicoccus luminyensis TaxID=1080712 RepID=UPI000369AC3C|nr:VWA domain-containing protein [Methanomassiliicoccus luminyensis]